MNKAIFLIEVSVVALQYVCFLLINLGFIYHVITAAALLAAKVY
jgi:hypothetical protein